MLIIKKVIIAILVTPVSHVKHLGAERIHLLIITVPWNFFRSDLDWISETLANIELSGWAGVPV